MMRKSTPGGPTSAVTAGPDRLPLHLEKVQERNIWALIIGIDQYESALLATLQGCRADAKDMAAYLTETLRAPPENVAVLQDECATRTAIMKCFEEHLLANGRINAESLVVFYFAGHGSRDHLQPKRASQNYPRTQELVETICPHDYGICDNIDNPLESSQVYGIPQHTMEGLLRAVERKGCSVVSTICIDRRILTFA